MRQLTIRPRTWPAVIGGGLVAASIAVAGTVGALTGSPGAVTGATARHHAAATPPGAASLTGSDLAAAPLSLPASGRPARRR